MMNTYKPTPEKVAEWIKDHQYTQLASTDAVEVWRAQKPGSSSYAFDITMSRYGIAVYGDIGNLVFNVGRSYGLKFLAGTDEDYVYRKLDHNCRETDLDEAYLVDIVHNAIVELLGERDLELPEFKQAPVPLAERVQELDDWLMEAAAKNAGKLGVSGVAEVSALVVALRECQNLEIKSVEAAYLWLCDRQELLELADDMDYTLSKPTNSVLQRLYLVRHAAQQILAAQEAAAKAAERAAEVEYAYSPLNSDDWTSDGIAPFVSDRELQAGTQIMRGQICRSQASDFLPDANDVIEHMANSAADENSEFCDGFPETTPEQETELKLLLEPLTAWANKHCSVSFYQVEKMEPYTVTAEDVAAGEAYRKARDAEVQL
jgi:hypothetical protein